jgi:hypothetical protein
MKSMNGVVTYDDGQGTVISGGTIETDTLNVTNLNTQNIVAPDPGADSSLYVDDITDVYLANSCSNLYLRTLQLNTFSATYGTTDFIQSTDSTKAIALFTNADNAIEIGSATSPLISNYTCVNGNELANKDYVDSVAGGGGGDVYLANNQTFTGINTFDNDTNIGLSSNTSTVNIYGEVNIGNGAILPGPNTQIYGDIVKIQGLSQTQLVSTLTSIGNNGTPAKMTFDISNAGEVDLNFNTDSSNHTTTTSQIIATGGNANYNGELTLNAGDITLNATGGDLAINSDTITVVSNNITIGDSSYDAVIKLRGGVEIGDAINIPSQETYIYGNHIYTSAPTSMSGSTKLFSITNYGSLTSSFNVDMNTPNEVNVEFNTNPLDLTEITSQINAVGTGSLTGSLYTTTGSLITTASTLTEFITPLFSIFSPAGAPSLEINPTGTQVSLEFKNASNIGVTKIISSGGTAAYNGILSFLAGTYSIAASVLIKLSSPLFTFENVAADTAMDIDVGTAGAVQLEFRTNTASPSTITSNIVASAGTTAGTGTILMDGGRFDMGCTNNYIGSGNVLWGNGSGDFPLFKGNVCVPLASGGVTTIDMSTIAWNTIFILGTGATLNHIITVNFSLSTRDGPTFYVLNLAATATVTVNATLGTTATNRIVGAGLSRTGVSGVTINSTTARMFRCCVGSSIFGTGSSALFTYVC